METIKVKYHVLNKALESLEESINYVETIKNIPHKDKLFADYEVIYKSARDSVIQRFKFCIELFWKYLRLYLEEIKLAKIDSNAPRDVIRSACQSNLRAKMKLQTVYK